MVLAPGLAADLNGFRLRAHCPVGGVICGRPSLKMRHSFTALAPDPHRRAAGQADKHARRVALFARRNHHEALHTAVKVGNKLGLRGAARQRTAKEPTVEAELSIALLARSAFMLADLRIQHDLFPREPPEDLAHALQR